MKKIFTLLFVIYSMVAQSQTLAEKLAAKANGQQKPSTSLPKGMSLYDKVHTDSTGISGVYYTKNPVRLFYQNSMNAYKDFVVNQMTIELVPGIHAGRFHFINDALSKKVRKGGIGYEESSAFEFYGMDGDIYKKIAEKFKVYGFQVNCSRSYNQLSYDYAGFNDVLMIQNINDPEVLLIGQVRNGKVVAYPDRNILGGYFNAMSKDQSKLAIYDSLKIETDLKETIEAYEELTNRVLGQVIPLPKMAINDDARETKYLAMIKPKAAEDKPVAWGTKLQYVYISRDWKVEYDVSGKNPTHRWCHVIAVSSGWGSGNGRYITVVIKEDYQGKDFGPSYFAGFKGSLVTVSEEQIKAFKH